MENKSISKCWYYTVCPQATSGCEDSCLKYLEMKHLMDESGLPEVKQKPIKLIPNSCDYDSFCELASIKDNIVDFVQDGHNLYIASENVGNGKTSWAIKLMLKYFDNIWAGNGFKTRAMFVSVPTLLLKLKDFKNPLSEEFKSNLLECDLVIWDDIGTGSITNYDYGNLFMYLDARLLNEKSNIFTSNITDINDLSAKFSTKLASRIWDVSKKIILEGGSKRGQSTNNI